MVSQANIRKVIRYSSHALLPNFNRIPTADDGDGHGGSNHGDDAHIDNDIHIYDDDHVYVNHHVHGSAVNVVRFCW